MLAVSWQNSEPFDFIRGGQLGYKCGVATLRTFRCGMVVLRSCNRMDVYWCKMGGNLRSAIRVFENFGMQAGYSTFYPRRPPGTLYSFSTSWELNIVRDIKGANTFKICNQLQNSMK